ncbi:MAG: glycosyltransferase [Fimbriimonadales bacterium]|nr:glycosyltransferase [Fimbriimonadales bacterium]MDW8051161.1 glycosyltransferase [Armatimonadota bacterium]
MRIGLFTVSLEAGGAERTFVTLANQFVRRGHTVFMVLMKPEGVLRKELHPAVEIVDLRTYRTLRTMVPLARWLRQARPDALLSTLSQPNLCAIVARRLAGVPCRVVVREANTPSYEFGNARLLKDRLVPAMIARLYRYATLVVAVSKGVQSDLLRLTRLPASRVVCIYNPTITEAMLQASEAPVEHPWFEAGAPPVVLAVGRLTPQKDYPTLLRAFAKVRATHNARLLILGEGEQRAELEQLAQQLGIAEFVQMPGYEPNPYRYMRRAAVFVLSSRYEGLPNALIQAMACGAPVVATDCPSGPREILDDGKYGALVPVGDADALAQAIAHALEGKVPIAPKSWLQQFEENHVAEQYLQVLQG